MFTRLKVQGYRCLANVGLALRPLNVLIGANGAGKSSLLDLFDLLARAAQADLPKAITERGGLSALLTSARTHPTKELKLELMWPEATEAGTKDRVYSVAIGLSGTGFVVEDETLDGSLTPHPLVSPPPPPPASTGWPAQPPPPIDIRSPPVSAERARSLGLAMRRGIGDVVLALADSPALHQLRMRLTSRARCTVVSVDTRSPIKLPQDLEPAQLLPGTDGETLVSALYNLRSEHPEVFERVVEAVRAGFPDFEGLDFPLAAAGKATFIWKASRFNGGSRGLYPHQLSDGMLRFLWLTTLLLSPQLPPLVTLDEPEVSLHPQLLMLLAGLLREASQRSQLLVATHSPELIRWLDPGDVVVLDMEEGVAQARRGDDPSFDIQTWLKDYTLGQLWVMGQLGGRT